MRSLAAMLLSLMLLAAPAVAKHVTVEAVVDRTAVEPGGTVRVALVFTIDPGWHVYWLNPGETGTPPKLKWTLPPGVTAAEPRFPTPRGIDADGLTAFGYEDSVALLVDVAVPADAKGSLELKADARWVVCSDACVAESQPVAITLPVGHGEPNAADKFAAWEAKQPERPTPAIVKEAMISANHQNGWLDVSVPPGTSVVDLFPPKANFVEYDRGIYTGGHYQIPFRLLPEPPPRYEAPGILVLQDNVTQKVSAQQITFTFKTGP